MKDLVEKIRKGMDVCMCDDFEPWMCSECPYDGNGCFQQLNMDVTTILDDFQRRLAEDDNN